MESGFRKTGLRGIVAAAAVLALGASPGIRQTEPFYNVDSEVRVQGTVREISFEVRYKGRSPFMVISLEQKDTGQIFRVDLSPSWFFGEDLHQGEKVEIVGSLVGESGTAKYVIAREILFRGQALILRDSRGFPEWRGGGSSRAARRRGRIR